MRKSFLFILVLALVAGLFVSCDSNVETREEFAYVDFSAEQGKEVVNEISENPELGVEYPVDGVYWFYTATKTEGRGTVGQTTTEFLINENRGLEGKIGPFSTGTWEFKLYGYAALTDAKKGEDLVYTGICTLGAKEGSVYLTRQYSKDETQTISVALINKLTEGTVNIADTVFYGDDNCDLRLTTKVQIEKASVLDDLFNATVDVEPIEVKANDGTGWKAGTYYYRFNMFEKFTSSASVAREVVDEKETDTIIWSNVPEGVYKIKSYLWSDKNSDGTFDDDELVLDVYDDYMILYPGEILTISGNIYDMSTLDIAESEASAVASVAHKFFKDGEIKTHEYWFSSLQDAVNYASEGDTVILLKDPDKNSIIVNRLIEISGDAEYVNKITTITSNSMSLMASSNVDGKIEFIADPARIIELLKAGCSVKLLSGFLEDQGAYLVVDTDNYVSLKEYAVVLNANEGTIPEASKLESYTYAIGAILPTEITKDGYTFGGWYDNDGFKGEADTEISEEDTGDKTFYAKWTVNTVII